MAKEPDSPLSGAN